MISFFHFLKAAIRHPKRVSTLFETGPSVANLLAKGVPDQPTGPVVELGVGTGAITQVLLEKMDSPEHYIGFELDESMVNFVNRRFPEARFINASAETFAEHLNGKKASAVVSSLPWTLMPADTVNTILENVRANLAPDGAFTTYLTAHVLKTPAGKRVRATLNEKFPNLQNEFIATNLPPARVFTARLS
jgi:phospholipid N-methyltransferase